VPPEGEPVMAKIVVIEDNDAVREEIADILTFEGHDIAQAVNGRLGFELVKELVPDLVLCDLMMPEMDGYATLEAIRSHPATATTPFVCLTARAERPDMRRAMELGADDYVTKPFTTDDLLGAVNAAFEKRARTARESEAKLSDFRQQLSCTLPHELRTPLSCILGYAEMLADPTHERESREVVTLAAHILEAGLRLNRIAENFLLYAQLTLLARGEASASGVRSRHLVMAHDVVGRLARQKAAEHRREHDLVLDLGQTAISMSESYLVKLMEEIVDNAFKFSEPGTPVQVSARASGGGLVLHITDRGRGMTAEQVAAIAGYVQFERILHEQQGLGLGLSIAQRIAALWGGTVAIESTPGQGTAVEVALPSTGGADAGDKAPATAAASPQRRTAHP